MKHSLFNLSVCLLIAVCLVGSGRIPFQSLIVHAQDETNQTAASNSFKTETSTIYGVDGTGLTTVQHNFTVTNLKPTTYLKQYQIKLQFPTLSNITATSDGKAIAPEVTKSGSATTITLNFTDEVVGEGKSRQFAIGYSTRDLSVGSGNVLELRIPPLQGTADSNHGVSVSLPEKYGAPVRSNPKPANQTIENGRRVLSYNQFSKDGISALFGDNQTYHLETTYSLKNPSTSDGYTQIALPPDTSFQRVVYRSLDPKPDSIKADSDGNWIATYTIPANTVVPVKLRADIKVTLDPDSAVPVPQPLPEHQAARPFWEVGDATITEFIADKSLQPIYQHVIDKLSYDTDRVRQGDITQRFGAVAALSQPSAAVCQEYADLLVTAWRNGGIPARRLNGYAFSQNEQTRPLSFRGTVLHAWADYYDPTTNIWRMVDPTWQDTTGGIDYFNEFDLNHVVLSINGLSSDEPAPAGSYTESPDEAQLKVVVTDPLQPIAPEFTSELTPKKLLGINIPGVYVLTSTNESGKAWYDTKIVLRSGENQIEAEHDFLPFTSKALTVALSGNLDTMWQPQPAELILEPKESSTPVTIPTNNVTAAPTYIIALANVDQATPLGVFAVLCFFTAGSLLVFRRKRKTPLRRKS